MSEIVERLRAEAATKIEQLKTEIKDLWELRSQDGAEIEQLRSDNERLRAHIRAQAEDIMTLGQMVGRCCPVCDRRALEEK